MPSTLSKLTTACTVLTAVLSGLDSVLGSRWYGRPGKSSSSSDDSSSSGGSSSSSSDDDNGISVCPGLLAGTPLENEDLTVPDVDTYNAALLTLDIESVFDDIYDLLLNSQECWPADILGPDNTQSYAGLFIRLAWHCAGTFREGDGVGGCAGGRIRYQPESAWDDNTNLDKARALLAPIKETYGDALSWGDLFIFAGTAAILQGNGPVTEVCAGRIDESDGTNSDPLNDPSSCETMGDCQLPLGASTVGLIYVDPTGFLGNPDPYETAPHVREIFARMGMNDYESVALIGGGHAFGKCHGACPLGAGSGPDEQPLNPWPGLCGQNFPFDIFTSGIEGQWTTYPFSWDNEFFTQLVEDEFELGFGPGGKYQWTNKRNGNLMLTTDIAFISDPIYKKIVEEFARTPQSLDYWFAITWQKLVTSGGAFADNSFCVNGNTLRPGLYNDDDDDDDMECPIKSNDLNDHGVCRCDDDYNCDKCPRNRHGCKKCKEGYFKLDDGYQCQSCDYLFNGCLECKDYKGCNKCENGYKRVYDKKCGLYKCVKRKNRKNRNRRHDY